MASNYIALYKRFNGVDWDVFYFATLATQVSETSDRKFLTATQQGYLTSPGTNGKVALLETGDKFNVSVIPALPYASNSNPSFTGTITGSSTGKAVLPGGIFKESNDHTGFKFVSNNIEMYAGNKKTLTLVDNTESTLVDLHTNKIINLGAPSSDADAVTKQYVDNLVSSNAKPISSVKVATTANITLSNTGQTIDGYVIVNDDRVLVKDQTTGSQNGIYIAKTSASWVKVTADTIQGALVFVENGTASNDFIYYCTNPTAGTWIIHSKVDTYTAGAGITKTGSQFSIGTGAITSTMIGNHQFKDNSNVLYDTWGELINIDTNGSLSVLISSLAGAIGLLRGTTSYKTNNTETITGAYSEIAGKAAIAQTMHIGTTSVAINRASAALSLTGITSIDGSAAKLTTTRAITIGSKANNFDGSAPITYTLADIGAAATGHNHDTAYRGITWVPGASEITGLGASYRWLTDTYISTWNAKIRSSVGSGDPSTSGMITGDLYFQGTVV